MNIDLIQQDRAALALYNRDWPEADIDSWEWCDLPTVIAYRQRARVVIENYGADAERKLEAIANLCDLTDIETSEATQAWLVGNIRAVLHERH